MIQRIKSCLPYSDVAYLKLLSHYLECVAWYISEDRKTENEIKNLEQQIKNKKKELGIE